MFGRATIRLGIGPHSSGFKLRTSRTQVHCLWRRSSESGNRITGKGLARPEGPQSEARKAEAGVPFFGRGSKPSAHQLEGLGERCKHPIGLRDGVLAAQQFSYIISTLDGFPCYVIE